MDIDLLGDSDDQQSCGLGPVIQPQPKTTRKVTEQLAKLNIGSTEDPATLSPDADDADEFGDFLQSEAAGSTWSPSEPQQTAPDSSRGSTSTEAVALRLPQPPPPASSSRPSLDMDPSIPLNARSRQSTTIGSELRAQSQPLDPMDSAAEQVLEWISNAHPATSTENASSQLLDSIEEAWGSAVGLMGGSDIKPHIGEIATRLCAVLPATTSQTINIQPPTAIVMPSVDTIVELSTVTSTVRSWTLIENTAQKVFDLVWPFYSKPKDLVAVEDTADERKNLVNAYLRLAEMTK
ncbi:hypothetical protein H4S00_000046 [Coemansia sp. D1744]|nr:hypothetical protein IWW46_003257 [Coemansia sp. RSA 2440]KAJ2730249.1 hypothetical protein H4S00_000046 [Coemansia sp. D1744]